jgi:sarcosine oxidase subunit beta
MVDEAVGRIKQDINYNTMVASAASSTLSFRLPALRSRRETPCGSRRRRGLLDASRCATWCRTDFDDARFPIQGGLLQRRGGTAR